MFLFPSSSHLSFEFDKIKEIISNNCSGNYGRDLVMQITPLANYEIATHKLKKTQEFQAILTDRVVFPELKYKDISKELSILKIESSVLQTSQLIEVLVNTQTTGSVFAFFLNKVNQYPLLESVIAGIDFKREIIEIITDVIDDFGIIKSSASIQLGKIRKSIAKQRAEADREYLLVINYYKKEGWLTDLTETFRNGRRVLSVVAEQKRALKGIVHDLSATGKTAFIEPEQVIAINNSISELLEEEKREIQIILKNTTSKIRQYHSLLEQYQMIIAEFDLIKAKSVFANETKSNFPHFINKPVIHLKNARHPLLLIHNKENGKPTIPFSLRLDGTNRILVISGPNAGGKTVCLKTIGLIQLMIQSGILVPLDAESTIGFFENLLIDIGDSQSIEYELSTYSSRLKHMKVFLEKANESTIFLIDEFGSGTDPDLGGALAEAILEELNEKNAYGIITTHYMNLKVLADKTKGIVNGSMDFDAKNLKPLYSLNVGRPGSSYTFVVAERSGIPGSLINRARQKVNKKHVLLEQLLNKVEKEKAFVQMKIEENSGKEKKLNELIRQSEKVIEENEITKNSFENRLKKYEQKIINQWEQTIKKFAREFKEAKNRKFVLDKFLGQIGLSKERLNDPKNVKRIVDPAIKKGSLVKLYNGRITGIVAEVKGQKAIVMFENVKTTCSLFDLILADKK